MDDKVKLFKCEDGFHYVEESPDLVWLGHWEGSESDEGTSTYMGKEAALGLAIELIRCSGVHESYLAPLERRLTWMQTEQLTAGLSGMELEELDKLSVQMFNVELVDRSMTLDDVRTVIRAYQEGPSKSEEPHVWEVYLNILDDRGRSKFYQQISLHATKAGAEQKVEADKKNWPEETSDPKFIVAARKLKIGA